MKIQSSPENHELIDKIISYAEDQLPTTTLDLISKFIRLYYSHLAYEDLQDRSVNDLYEAALSHIELMRVRAPDEVKIQIFNPQFDQQGWQSTHTVIQMISQDTPFIIDSIRMELNRLGLTIHLIVHMGGMKVLRDENNHLIDILDYDSKNQNALIEAPVYFEVDRQTNPQTLETIQQNIYRVMQDIRLVVGDWENMKQRLRECIDTLRNKKMPQQIVEIDESIAFCVWLLEDHFTFIGARDYDIVGSGDQRALCLIKGSGLGVLRDESKSQSYRQFSDMPESARELALSTDQVLVISKTNTRSTVHRDAYTDDFWIKVFNEKGELIGIRRFIGLLTSTAYSSDPKDIPLLRRKVQLVLKKSGLQQRSHSGKDLMYILATLPRDDLFLASVDELYEIATGILHLQERRRIRLFAREDAYGRFVSCLVYIPRENFNTRVIYRMQNVLMEAFQGLEVQFSTHFSESILARIHYLIRKDRSKKLSYDLRKIEQRLVEIGRSWQDGFREAMLDYYGEEQGNELINIYRDAFPLGYCELFSPRMAVFDIEYMQKLSSDLDLGMSFYRPLGSTKNMIRFKLYHLNTTIPLSDALPMLENMGLRVIGEQPYQITLQNGSLIWINDLSMIYPGEVDISIDQVKQIFQDTFRQVWLGGAENDNFNRLVLSAQLDWREVSVLRAYSRYLRQIGFTFSLEYIAETLVNNPEIARLLIKLFYCCFDPHNHHSVEDVQELENKIIQKFDEVVILDEDRILRRYLVIIRATLRTNFFQCEEKGQWKNYFAFKIDSSKVPDMPLPLPRYETFVYSPSFEGVHLRMAKVARGGIRWSDRREDFRTEVLGLMKAQQVKNSVIVPAGAKGGFIVKNLPFEASREVILKEGIDCYRGFIHGLLDLVDNIVDGKIVPPKDTVCYDEADPYLVVAADKGTATFSDIANRISLEYQFWLGDAFASGGSTGYDHKKMGITARGAWISGERHFQELNINLDQTEVTAIGIGDMSGDVFGNGLLLSNRIKLIAAFNHQHIFLDPHPNPEKSYIERRRLFELPRSSWEDYDQSCISSGGGVYRRSAKYIKISPEIKQLLQIDQETLIPNELIKVILTAPVDMIWNGGIGTYVKASSESNQEVGDRGNDNVRVDANQLRALVVCEGGNLGFTQLARIEYQLQGGYINTDFIDNSAGVDCSDHEVNIKILLHSAMTAGELTEKQRNKLLARMKDEVAELVLQNNYHQNRAISMATYLSVKNIGPYITFIAGLEQQGKLNRQLEFLPDKKTLLERKATNKGLTKPEMSVLFAYSKIILKDYLRKWDLVKYPYLYQFLKKAFPTPLRETYSAFLSQHRLRQEIIATQISNHLVADMGITFVYQVQDETGAEIINIVRAYAAVGEIFHMAAIYADIESLDFKVEATLQYDMTDEVARLARRSIRWILRNIREEINVEKTIKKYAEKISELYKSLPSLLLGNDKIRFEKRRDELMSKGVPAEIALTVAATLPMYHTLNIIEAAISQNLEVERVAKTYFTLADRLDLIGFRDQVDAYLAEGRWSALAKAACKADLDQIQRKLTIAVMNLKVPIDDISERIHLWFSSHKALIKRWEAVLDDLRKSEIKQFDMLTVALRELWDLSQS